MTEVLMWHSKKPRRLRLRGFSIPFWVGGLIPRLATSYSSPSNHCRIPHKPCSIGVLCRAYKGGNPYQSSFTADTGTYRLCADKVVCKRVYEVERILLN